MIDKTIEITLFHNFSMKYDTIVLQGDDLKSEKLIKLFSYLLYYYDRNVPSSELIDLIWYFEEIDNPLGALKNLIYRLRAILKTTLGINDLIVTGKSCYFINCDYDLRIDVHLFEKYNKQILEKGPKKDIYIKLIDIYKGYLLSRISGDYRLTSRSSYYHSLYISRVIEYANILESKQAYDIMETVAKKAIAIDELDENLYIILIKSLYYQKFYQKAIDTYKDITDFLYRALGTNPSEEMRNLYSLIKKEKHSENMDIGDIQKGLVSTEKHGAFLCEYGAFRDLYDFEARMIKRLGVCTHLCVVTVNDQSRYEVDKDKNAQFVEKTMQKIQTSLVAGLRGGDVVSRFSINQFVVMLPVCNYENSVIVMDRILKKIKRSLNNEKISMKISIKEVEISGLEGE